MNQASNNDPHANQPIATAGAGLTQAKAAVILIHGRGSSPSGILPLVWELDQAAQIAQAVAFLAPSAAGGTWYPYPFRTLTRQNEPYLSSALAKISSVFQHIRDQGIPAERILLVGFSQGACLALEWAARNAQRLGGVAGLSGGVIGADGEPRQDRGNLSGTPVFLGCSDVDFHIPKERVEFSAKLMAALGGEVTLRLYPGMGHLVNEEELAIVSGMIQNVIA